MIHIPVYTEDDNVIGTISIENMVTLVERHMKLRISAQEEET